MLDLGNVVVLSVDNVMNVYSEQGHHTYMNRRETYGLSFAKSGTIRYILNGESILSTRTHAVILPQGQSYLIRREETGEFPVINFTCTAPLTKRIERILLQNPESYLKDAERMRRLYLSGKNPAAILSIFYGILARLEEEEREDNEKQRLLPAIEYLSEHLSCPELDNRELAEAVGVSEVYFRRLFRECYGQSPRQYVLEARMRLAKTLLAEQASTVTAVSEACGFSSIYHFCRAFKHHTGQTPKEYAQRNSLPAP